MSPGATSFQTREASSEGTAVLPLSNGGEVIVDASDLHWITKHKWRLSKYGNGYQYAIRTHPSGQHLFLHKEVVGAGKHQIVDHINRNPLDNRRSNLRLCTLAQNNKNASLRRSNTSGFRGVYCRGNYWSAAIESDGRKYNLGTFATAEDAAKAYDEAAKRLHQEFASLNYPEAT